MLPLQTTAVLLGADESLTRRLAQALGSAPAAAARPDPADPGAPWIYLAAARGDGLAPDLADAAATFDAWAASDSRHLVVVASAAVHEPNWHHPGLVAEDHPPSRRARNPVTEAWRRLEARARRAAVATGRPLALLRPAPVPLDGGRDPFSRLFAGRFAVTVAGHHPPVQTLAAEDLARGVALAIERRAAGAFHLAPDGAEPLDRALGRAGVRCLPLPRLWQLPFRRPGAARGRAWRAGELDYLRYAWTVSAERARRELGWRPPPVAGTPAPDPWGLSRPAVERAGRTWLAFLRRLWWRLEVAGLEHLPPSGPAVLVGFHRGFFPYDAIVVLDAVARASARMPRFLIHPGLIKFPFLHDLFLRLGGVLACEDNAVRLLGRGEIVGMLPEGARGAFARYRDAYRLVPFRRTDFARLALEHGAPILPFALVGPAEALPILARIESRRWRRYSEWPCLPITPTFPFLPLPLPLPSKWRLRFLPPLEAPASGSRDAAARLAEETWRRLRDATLELRRGSET